MGTGGLVSQYILPVGFTILLVLFLFVLLTLLARRGIAIGLWARIASRPKRTVGGVIALLLVVVLATFALRFAEAERFRAYERHNFNTASNLLAPFLIKSPLTSTLQFPSTVSSTSAITESREYGTVEAQSLIRSNLIAARPGSTYRYSMDIGTDDSVSSDAQIRFLWLDRALKVLIWNDTPVYRIESEFNPSGGCYGFLCSTFHTGAYKAPEGAAYLVIELRNLVGSWLYPREMKLSQDGVYIESHPNGAQGALAFSFDWESAMGGAIHSRGMTVHDPKGAAEHGQAMRDGAAWLNKLFNQHNIKATFYATGYNLLDGNTQRREFSGNPTYKWARIGNGSGWDTNWWLTHTWYSDDPFGAIQTDPAWYFGDQTRTLLQAGHEIAPHTFGHLYVRGAKPQELATDMDEWLSAAKSVGVPAPTTFAFPWRSSNSLTADFYKVLGDRGIRAVTRIYAPDMKDQYTVGAVGVYPDISVMPDFLLGAESAVGGEGAGAPITGEQGIQVITETLSRRGATSFWQHPEQLAPGMKDIQAAWTQVVSAAAQERDKGRLWIATVADITAYPRDVMSVTVSLSKEWLGGTWKIHVNNALDKPISGVTITLPGDAARATSSQVDVRTVYHPTPDTTKVSDAGKLVYPARQIVLNDLKPGASTIDVEWARGQEPPQ